MVSGKLRDPGIEVALERKRLRNLGYSSEVIDGMTTTEAIMDTCITNAIRDRQEQLMAEQAWFARAAKDAMRIRIQPVSEAESDG